jgi:protein-arginine kinase
LCFVSDVLLLNVLSATLLAITPYASVAHCNFAMEPPPWLAAAALTMFMAFVVLQAALLSSFEKARSAANSADERTQPARHRLCGKLAVGYDPAFDIMLDPQLAANQYPLAKLEVARAANHTSLAARFCTPSIWEKYKDKRSTGPAKWTLARAINTGVMYPESFVGCHAGDRESYDDFKDFFYPLIEAYHTGFSMDHAVVYGSASDRMDPFKISATLSASATAKIISTRIRLARNLAMFPLNPGGTRDSREAVSHLMQRVYSDIKDHDLAGEYRELVDVPDADREDLIDKHLLFRGKDKMQAASGYHEHWPHGRGFFLNPARTFINWINEGDHLRIVSMQQGGDVAAVFRRLASGVAAIEEGVRKEMPGQLGPDDEVFMMHPKFGSVACCPSNIGTGMRGSVHILVPKLISTMGFDAIDKLARERNCQARGSNGEHSAVVDRIDVSNWRRIGFPEYELVQDMINCANFFAAEEDKLPELVKSFSV